MDQMSPPGQTPYFIWPLRQRRRIGLMRLSPARGHLQNRQDNSVLKTEKKVCYCQMDTIQYGTPLGQAPTLPQLKNNIY
jgi:hypothetical protein